MRQTIINAINGRKVLAFTYDNISRTVEPHAVGMSTAGNDVLRCYQTQGGHVSATHAWDLCELSKMSQLRETGDSFASARPGYRRGDKAMTHIYAEL
jgi:hypothetical protein